MKISKATATTQGLGRIIQIQHPSVQFSVHRLVTCITASLVCFSDVIGEDGRGFFFISYQIMWVVLIVRFTFFTFFSVSSENKILGLISNLCVNNLSIILKTALQKILQIPQISASSNKKNHFSLSCKLEHIHLYTNIHV